MNVINEIPCTKSELSLFQPRPIQVVAESARWVDVHPVNSLSVGGPIEFFIAGGTEDYLDLNDTYIVVRVRIVVQDTGAGTSLVDEKVAFCNNVLSSLFSDVCLTLGEKQIEGSTQMYPYKSYFANNLLFTPSTQRTQLAAQGFLSDIAGKLDDATSSAHLKRMKWTEKSKVLELAGPLLLDFFLQPEYLLNQVDMRLKLIRSKPEFVLNCFEGAKNFAVIIDEAVLYVRTVKVAPELAIEHNLTLKNQPAVYDVQHSEMITFTIPKDTQSANRQNLFRGQMPKLIIIGMVENAAFNGSYAKNPFNFQHFNVCEVGLYREGESIPSKPYTPNFEKNLIKREYLNTFLNLEMFNRDETHSISYEDFADGSSLFIFNLTPDLQLSGHRQPYREGNLRLEFKFSKPLESTINVVCMAVMDGKVDIDYLRTCTVDYKS